MRHMVSHVIRGASTLYQLRHFWRQPKDDHKNMAEQGLPLDLEQKHSYVSLRERDKISYLHKCTS